MPKRTVLEVFGTKLDLDALPGCMLWKGATNPEGYGIHTLSRRRHPGRRHRTRLAHRYSYTVWRGPIPRGRQVDHICHDWRTCPGGRNCLHRRCINPEHLKVRTAKANNERSNGPSARRGRQTHCIHGHPLVSGNIDRIRVRGHIYRRCSTCRRARNRAHKARRAQLGHAPQRPR